MIWRKGLRANRATRWGMVLLAGASTMFIVPWGCNLAPLTQGDYNNAIQNFADQFATDTVNGVSELLGLNTLFGSVPVVGPIIGNAIVATADRAVETGIVTSALEVIPSHDAQE